MTLNTAKAPSGSVSSPSENFGSAGWNVVENKKERGKLFSKSHHTSNTEDFYSLEDDQSVYLETQEEAVLYSEMVNEAITVLNKGSSPVEVNNQKQSGQKKEKV